MFAKMRVVGGTGPTHIQPLKEEKAIELGAEFLGELFIYTVASSIIMFEYWRSSRNEAAKEAEQNEDINILKHKLLNIEDRLSKIETTLHSKSK